VSRDPYNNCFTPWPDMGQAMRVYAEDGPSPTLASHHILVLHGFKMSKEEEEFVIPLKMSNTKANGSNIGEVGDPMYTLDTTGSHAVAYEVPDTPYLVDAQRVGDFRTYEAAPSLCARMGTGGNNVPVLVMETEDGS
jgi:hypothetical protein